MGGKCVGLKNYPNATIAEYGEVQGADDMAKEIWARGPISCGIDAVPILNYTVGIATDDVRCSLCMLLYCHFVRHAYVFPNKV